jgi:YcxB-like protein
MHEEFTYRVDDSGLYVSTPLGQAHRPWANFLRYRENDDLFLLYHSDVMFELLPKRWFADDTALNAFRTEVARRISR